MMPSAMRRFVSSVGLRAPAVPTVAQRRLANGVRMRDSPHAKGTVVVVVTSSLMIGFSYQVKKAIALTKWGMTSSLKPTTPGERRTT